MAIGGAALVACAPAPAGSVTTTSSSESAPAVANVEVSMWMFSLTDPNLLKLIDETVGPNFTGIRPEFVPHEGYYEKIATNLAGGTLPDIHESGTQEAGQVATSGMGIPLDDMMAISFLVTLVPLLIFFFAQKYFIRGIAMTGIKA